MNLHDIIPHRLIAWCWYSITGGNGQYIGGQAMFHLFEVERGDPPPMDEDVPGWRQHRRLYWYPWGGNPPWNTNPRETALCKLQRVRTQARFMRVNQAWGGELRCPECTAIATQRGLFAGYKHDIARDDPWNTIPQVDRQTTPDPVTGL